MFVKFFLCFLSIGLLQLHVLVILNDFITMLFVTMPEWAEAQWTVIFGKGKTIRK
jgi:hypothetical protein